MEYPSSSSFNELYLFQVDDPLEQAMRFLQPLQSLAKDRIETHLMAFEVYYRKSE